MPHTRPQPPAPTRQAHSRPAAEPGRSAYGRSPRRLPVRLAALEAGPVSIQRSRVQVPSSPPIKHFRLGGGGRRSFRHLADARCPRLAESSPELSPSAPSQGACPGTATSGSKSRGSLANTPSWRPGLLALQGSRSRLRQWLVRGEAVGISAVSWTEFLCGSVQGHAIELAARVVEEPVALLAVDAAAAKLFNLGGRREQGTSDFGVFGTTHFGLDTGHHHRGRLGLLQRPRGPLGAARRGRLDGLPGPPPDDDPLAPGPERAQHHPRAGARGLLHLRKICASRRFIRAAHPTAR